MSDHGTDMPAPGEAELAEAVARRLAALRERLHAAAPDGSVPRILAVTKGFGGEHLLAAAAAGIDAVGENYAQELVAKAQTLDERRPGWRRRTGSDGVDVHFIGQLQRNKVGGLAPLVDVWQSVDRPRLVSALARRVPRASVLVQVNLTGSPGQGGCAPEMTPDLVAQATDEGLDVRGLMVVGPQGSDEAITTAFEAAARLREDLDLAELSMGMSDDCHLAAAAGSTMVRVGRALLGPRLPAPGAHVAE